MKQSIIRMCVLAALAFIMGTGCALNNIQHVEQPSEAAPGTAIDVYVFDTYSILGQDSVLATDWVRDSVLVAAMLPSGWTVNTAEYYIDNDAYANMIRYGEDPGALDIGHLMDSLSGSIVTPVATDAYDVELDTTFGLGLLEPHAYMGADPINVPAGTAMDTIVEDTSGTLPVDSLYMKVVGCYVHYNITTGSVEDTFDLGYFVGFMPDSIAVQNAENAYADSNIIVISNNTGIASAANRQIRMEVTNNPVTAKSVLSYYVPAAGKASLTLVDARGGVIESRSIDAQSGWNRQQLGNLIAVSLQPGVYFLRIVSGSVVTSHRLVVAE